MFEFYNKLLESGAVKPDEAQEKVARRLEELAAEIVEYANSKGNLLGRVFSKKTVKPKGLFIYGKVGRGKSMLMDAFFKSLPVNQKKRAHFHEFMQGVHTRMHELRTQKIEGDVVAKVAAEFASGIKLLCFDEYEVNDVTDATILSKLFYEMSELGVVFVFTSNRKPEDHYKDGLQRQSYLEFCHYLSEVLEVISLDAKRDYRLNQQRDHDNYYIPAGYEATQEMKEKFKLISAEVLKKVKIYVNGRELNIRAAGRILWAEFHELCGQPLGNADYIEIAKSAGVLFLENVPKMDEDSRNEARRFINLIDILYEHHVMLIASFAVEPEELYYGTTAGFEFARTTSRLKEMRGWKRKKDDEERLD